MLVSCDVPDAAITVQLQQLVDSSHASITILVIPLELITHRHTDRSLPQSAVGLALQDLPTPDAVWVMHATEPAPEAGLVSNHLPGPSVHSVLGSASSSGGLTLAEVTVKVRLAAVTAMGECSSDQAKLEDDEPLLAAGLSSAGAVEIVRLLEEEFDMTLPYTVAFDYPTVADLAAHLASLLSNTATGSAADAAQPAVPAVPAANPHSEPSAALTAASTAATAAALTAASASGPISQLTRMTAAADCELTAAAQRATMMQLVTAAAAEALYSSGQVAGAPPLQEPLMEAGLASAGAVQLVALLEAATGLELPGTLAFDYPTIAEITNYLLSLQPASQALASSGSATSHLQHSSALRNAAAVGGIQTEVAAVAAAAAQSNMLITVVAAVTDVLGLPTAEAEELSLDSPLMDAGLTSTLAIQLTTQLESALQMDLPGTLAFDYPPIGGIATFLESLTDSTAPPSALASAPTPASSCVPDRSGADVLNSIICELVEDILGEETVGVSTPLLDAGLTSASAVQLTAALEDALGTDLPGTLVFDYPTIASLVSYLTTCNIKLPTDNPTVPSCPNAASASTASAAAVCTAVSQPALEAAPIAQVPKAVSSATANGFHRAIAIVSSAHRVPGGVLQPQASTPPVDRVTAVPLERWDSNEPPLDNASELNAAFGAFILSADEFDAAAFHLSAAEATLMDPQQRLLLETFAEAQQGLTNWVSLSDVNSSQYVSSSSNLKQRFGVYVGVSQLEYARITYETGSNLNAYYATGAHLSVTSGRIAYTFGLKGPAMAGVPFIHPTCIPTRSFVSSLNCKSVNP